MQAVRPFLRSAILVFVSATLGRGAGVLGIAVFGLAMPVSAWQFVRPGRLSIGPDGVTERVTGRTRRLAWHETANFRALRTYRTERVIFDDCRPPGVKRRLRAVRRALGIEAALKRGWTLPAQDLAHLLNAERAHWLGRAGRSRTGPD